MKDLNVGAYVKIIAFAYIKFSTLKFSLHTIKTWNRK